MLTEEWRDIPGYEGLYQVSDLGRVRSVERTARIVARGTESVRTVAERILIPTVQANGRLRVCLARNGTKTYEHVYALVLETFVGPCPSGMQACHYPDRDPANNRLDNLRWGTPKENAADRDAHGTTARGERIGGVKLNENQVLNIRLLAGLGDWSHRQIANLYGVTRPLIGLIVNRKIWRHV